MERDGSTLSLRMVETVCTIFVTVVGPQVEQFDDISPKERISDTFEPFRLELRPQMVQDSCCSNGSSLASERRDRGPSAHAPTKDLVDVLSVNSSVVSKTERNLLSNWLDEEVKKLPLVNSIVCLLAGVHILSKQMF